jgi:hypothetical protein
MTACVTLKREMLNNPIHLKVAGEVDFARARALAEARAREAGGEPMLLAWYNGVTGEFSPQVTCCGEDKPTWLIYAESRGGDLVIDINDEAYVFVYRRTM